MPGTRACLRLRASGSRFSVLTMSYSRMHCRNISLFVGEQTRNTFVLSLDHIRPGLPDKIIGRPWSWPAFQRKMTTAHPGSLHRFDLFSKYGSYDTSYKIVGDYELLLRPGSTLSTIFVDEVTAKMLAGGNSDRFPALTEARLAKIRTGRRNRLWALWELWVEIQACGSPCRGCMRQFRVLDERSVNFEAE